ncbi:MAG: hypothetical protein L0H29_11375 [Sinobacteraceae bacterium]|nr:hypothetical protein [Nevskiaceae bacterium]
METPFRGHGFYAVDYAVVTAHFDKRGCAGTPGYSRAEDTQMPSQREFCRRQGVSSRAGAGNT